jgi:hypothetical protein
VVSHPFARKIANGWGTAPGEELNIVRKWRASKKGILVIVAFLTTATLGIVGYMTLFAPDRIIWRGEINNGNDIVRKIESYRQQHGRLPKSLADASVEDRDLDKFFYEGCSDTRYLVWFGTRLGESMTYDSASRDWKPLNVTCP